VLDDSATSGSTALQLSDLLIEKQTQHVPWIFGQRIRANLASRELLAKMKAAGLKRTAFGGPSQVTPIIPPCG